MAKYAKRVEVSLPNRTWPDNEITRAPYWCSVDLRDGNQALAKPYSLEERLEMFDLLVEVGFKEIEVGFPSASQIDFDFLRILIEENRVPAGVYLQVLTQAREHLIRRTFESFTGAENVILHLYNSTSPLQRDITFRMGKDEIRTIAADGTALVKRLLPEAGDTNIRFEYSPESFSDTEIDYALDVCEAVMEVWEPTEKERIILNLPSTVENATPNVYADQIEWFCTNMKNRDKAIISLHTHNDRGTGVAATELGLLAGAERVEGTLFGNGERTGNLDVVTVALNMYSLGVDPGLDFSNLPHVSKVYETCTHMPIHPRQPYAGELVFTAFSGSHQDAIKKGMDVMRGESDPDAAWRVPYLPIDPKDIGRTYRAIVRINSQSGKGGAAYILSREFGYELPKPMHPGLGTLVNTKADEWGRELSPKEVYDIFAEEFMNRAAPLAFDQYGVTSDTDGLACSAMVTFGGESRRIAGRGNGPIDAFVHAMKEQGWDDFTLMDFHEHSVGSGSDTAAVAYVRIDAADGTMYWGAGKDTDINKAGLKALVSAFNRKQNA